VPVADLDGQPEPAQSQDPAQAPESVDEIGVVAVSALSAIAWSSRSRRCTVISIVS
jgi:hypothetical protein